MHQTAVDPNCKIIYTTDLTCFVEIAMPRGVKKEAVKKDPGVARAPNSNYRFDEKYMGTEPVWDTQRALAMSDADFDHHLRKSLNWYNYMFTSKELKKYVVEWLQNNTKFSSQELSTFIKSSDNQCPVIICSLVMAHRRGMPMKPKFADYIVKTVTDIIVKNKSVDISEAAAEKPAELKITVADRVAEKTSEYLGELEGLVDDYVFNKKEFNLFNWLKEKNVPTGSINKFRQTLSRQQLEFATALEGQDAQLKEAYRAFTRPRLKQIVAFYERLWQDLDSYAHAKKITRKVRVKKSPSKEKLVSKLKYCNQDTDLKITSINPVDIIGAQKLWVYNTKTRKIYRYQVDSISGGLTVKGTTIVGFDEAKSVGKTVRKPQELLPKFMKLGKVQLRKFLEEINAVEIKANGRINEDTLLLRIE